MSARSTVGVLAVVFLLKPDQPPIREVWGRLSASFPTSELFLLPSARHYVQMDEPEEVARLILYAPVR